MGADSGMTGAGERAPIAAARQHNRGAVLDLILRQPGISRVGIVQQTGLSRSTVSRVTDGLIGSGMVVEEAAPQTAGRGRPSPQLRIATSVGQVVGLDVGVASCRGMATNLSGEVLARLRTPTPADLDVPRFAEWLAEQIDGLRAQGGPGPLLHLVVSFPAKVRDGLVIERPARGLNHLAGSELYARLSRRLAVPLTFRNDPDMALLGEMHDGQAVGRSDAVLVIISAALAASVAIDGQILGGRRKIIGEFGRMPFDDAGTPMSSVLTAQGITDRAAEAGVVLETLQDLVTRAGEPLVDRLREEFTAGLTRLLIALALSVDPEIIVLAGRLLDLAVDVLGDVRARLAEVLPVPPEVATSQTLGYSQPRGAAQVALQSARAELLERVQHDNDA
ncbi:ROK family transcriptional regulator [Amycolatopsis acidicola]|uniref:ROK family transcriptional regulator n=1 Tax=Amycolatopsis acidicola TaxID=2596893 RepID=A0A5N0VG18_9PSEU|nr:ROK family transcriptional regulator [Amycolatopsis acidicola]KAA9164384.1 ROK family transcriptional regulator [Amycolatopsis acidicola]